MADPTQIPELIPLCAIFTLAVLALSNAAEVRSVLGRNPTAGAGEIFLGCLPGRTATLCFGVAGGFFIGLLLGCRGAMPLGIACAASLIGFALNLPFLIHTVQRARHALNALPLAVEESLNAGAAQACLELDRNAPDRRIWGACLRQADDDPAIAGTYYVLRRGRALARDNLLAQRRDWMAWIPANHVGPTIRSLTGAWSD
jgi:hypothetical protein